MPQFSEKGIKKKWGVCKIQNYGGVMKILVNLLLIKCGCGLREKMTLSFLEFTKMEERDEPGFLIGLSA